jgi:PPP family 3-phenylpropionic acid transporter
LADRTGERKRLMVAFSLIAVGSFALFAWTDSRRAILCVSVVYFAAWPPIVTLAESVTMQATRVGRVDYGRVRLWGSLSFIAAAVLAGQLLDATSATAWAIYGMILAAQVTALLTCCALPDTRADKSRSHRLPLIDVLQEPAFVALLVACGLIQGSHAVYYAFATLAWKAAGFSEAIIGALWAEAVLAEVVLFACGSRLVQRTGPEALLGIAGIAAAVRWIGSGLTDALPALAALQLLHAFSFGAAHLAAMHLISRNVAQQLSATAQSLYSGVVWGVFLGALLFAAGLLYQRLGSAAFLVMAAVGLLGGLIAFVALPARSHRGMLPR